MSRRIAIFLSLTVTGLVYGQAAVEAGLGASRAATSTAPAKGIGKSMSGLAGSLDKALKPVQKEAAEEATPAPAPAPVVSAAKAAPVKQKFEDAGGIEVGLVYDELVRRFGPASMAMTLGAERSLSYAGKEGMFQVTVQDGKVKSVDKPVK
jgi:hypothetical protein